MARLPLSLLLALGLHLLLFGMMIPVRETRAPLLSGRGQVTVTLAGPAKPLPAPVAENPMATPPSPAPAAPKPPVAASLPREAPVAPPPRPVSDQGRKKVPARKEPVARLPQVAALPAGGKAPPAPAKDGNSGRPVDGDDPDAPQDAAVAALRQAVPLPAANRPPTYPALARKRGWEGRVLLAVEVAADGTAQDVRVQAGSGHDLLDAAAVQAVRQWRFQPGARNGEPVAMQVLVPVHFLLQDNP